MAIFGSIKKSNQALLAEFFATNPDAFSSSEQAKLYYLARSDEGVPIAALARGLVTSGNTVVPFDSVRPTIFITAHTDGLTDVTEELQAAIDAASHSWLHIPKGRYLISGQLTSNAPITITGDGCGSVSNTSGAGAVLNVGFVHGGTTIQTSSLTNHVLTFNSSGSHIDGIAFINTGTDPTAGSALRLNDATGATITRCNLVGFYKNVWIVNGYNWHLSMCGIYDPKKYGIEIQDVAIPDGGDPSVSDSTFSGYTKSYLADSAIYITSGGGLKLNNCKCNGGVGVGGFVDFVTVDIPNGTGTSDLLITNCSIENFFGYALRLTGTGSGLYQNILFNGNQIYGGTGVGGVKTEFANIKHFSIQGNIFNSLTGDSILLNASEGGSVGRNYHVGVAGSCVKIGGTGAANVSVDAQVRYDLGSIVTDLGNSNVNYRDIRDTTATGASARKRLYTLTAAQYTAGLVDVTVTGSVETVGSYALTSRQKFAREGTTAVGLATVGSDISAGVAASGVALEFDNTTTPGNIEINLVTGANPGVAYCKVEIKVTGRLAGFKAGA